MGGAACMMVTRTCLTSLWRQFPDNMGSPVVKYTSLHCIFTPDNNTLTLNPMERVVETFSDIVLYTPEGPHDLGKCEQEWLTGAVAGGKDVVFPPPGMCLPQRPWQAIIVIILCSCAHVTLTMILRVVWQWCAWLILRSRESRGSL